MTKNFNITIVITRDDFYRNFYKTEAFKDLDSEFNVSYVLSNNLPKEETKRKVFYFQKNLNKKTNFRFNYRTFLLMYRAKNKSRTFQFRIERMLYPLKFNVGYIPNFNFLKKKDKIKKIFFCKNVLNKLKYKKLNIFPDIIFNIFSKILLCLKKNKFLKIAF